MCTSVFSVAVSPKDPAAADLAPNGWEEFDLDLPNDVRKFKLGKYNKYGYKYGYGPGYGYYGGYGYGPYGSYYPNFYRPYGYRVHGY
ncbi:unnamed protein product [Agarophyton chilense]